MYYYKARIYSPLIGRFMQTDPIGYDDQMNLYGYVGNDPVNAVDPSGKEIVLAAHNLFAGFSHTKIIIIPEKSRVRALPSLFLTQRARTKRTSAQPIITAAAGKTGRIEYCAS